MEDKEYFTAARANRHQTRIKRSLFIGSLFPAADRDSAEKNLSEIRSEFHDATHNCYAYRIDENDYRFSDDGEPSGTAGMPILKMLDKYRLLHSLLIITRYFGGIKLGTGGLIRAYSQCAEETIQNSPRKKFVQHREITIRYPYHLTRRVHYTVSKYDGIIEDSQFGSAVISRVKIPFRQGEDFEEELLRSGTGQIQINHNIEA